VLSIPVMIISRVLPAPVPWANKMPCWLDRAREIADIWCG
jgi:hypothetical protein